MKTYILNFEIWRTEHLGKQIIVAQTHYPLRRGLKFDGIDDVMAYIMEASAEQFPAAITQPTEYTAYVHIFVEQPQAESPFDAPEDIPLDNVKITCTPGSNTMSFQLASTDLLK